MIQECIPRKIFCWPHLVQNITDITTKQSAEPQPCLHRDYSMSICRVRDTVDIPIAAMKLFTRTNAVNNEQRHERNRGHTLARQECENLSWFKEQAMHIRVKRFGYFLQDRKSVV